MILPDVNVLLYAFRRDAERHDDYRSWLDTVVNGEAAYGISPQVLALVIRIATHRRIRASEYNARGAGLLRRDSSARTLHRRPAGPPPLGDLRGPM